MPRTIIKLSEGDKTWYLEWSNMVDAPITFGMSLEEYREYYQEEYGLSAMHELPERLQRVEEKGTSDRRDKSVDDTIGFNRAGKNETCLSKQQIIDFYCKHTLADNSTQKDLEEYEKKKPKGKKLT